MILFIFLSIVYVISFIGVINSYIKKDIMPGCTSFFFLLCPVINTIIFILYLCSIEENGKSKLVNDTKCIINEMMDNLHKIFTNNIR